MGDATAVAGTGLGLAHVDGPGLLAKPMAWRISIGDRDSPWRVLTHGGGTPTPNAEITSRVVKPTM
jgi:hypothetical protein